MIKVNNVSKKYTLKNREIFALKETSFSIEDNKLTVIYGKSGSGKTTLLNIMAGLLPPSNGSVLLDGVDPYLFGDKELSLFRNKNIGYIPQGTSSVSSLTVLENAMLPANIYEANDIKEKAVSLLKDLGLENLMDSYPAELSGGELRRVSIARAIINSPKMIFADEPTNDLDKENTEFVLKLLKEKSREGMSVVIVSHDEAAMKYAEEADVLNVAMFGMTAKQWREANPNLKGNIRDYDTINELICLSNMENINAVLINDGMTQGERLIKLNQIAIHQMQVLEDNEGRKLLK